MIIDCISALPPHHQLYITHNGHNTGYETIIDYLSASLREIDTQDLQKMIESNCIWEVQLYPHTNFCFYWSAASTLQRAIELIMENYKDGIWI